MLSSGAADPQSDRSYRALLAVPGVGRILLGMQISRIAQSMVSVTIVLFTLAAYKSPVLSGIATFFSISPGLLVSPMAGALLDRHGRTRLVSLDYFFALLASAAIGILALTGALPAWLFIVITAVASLTAPLSSTGLRSIFPVIVPYALWERVNAVDSMGFVIATIIGPPLAAGLVEFVGGPVTFIIIGVSYGVAGIIISRAPEPLTAPATTGRLLADAWAGLAYTWRNATLRGLGFSVSVLNLATGAITIFVPLLVLRELHFNQRIVGLMFAIQGVTGVFAAFIFGRMDTRGRERAMLGWSMALMGITLTGLLVDSKIAALMLVMATIGFLNGPMDIALFTLRQRRTDPSWTGRAFAVSMSFNYAGTPIGAAVAGVMASTSIRTAIVFAAVASLVAGALAMTMIPNRE